MNELPPPSVETLDKDIRDITEEVQRMLLELQLLIMAGRLDEPPPELIETLEKSLDLCQIAEEATLSGCPTNDPRIVEFQFSQRDVRNGLREYMETAI